MHLYKEWVKLLQEIGPGKMMTTAYDTAWIARLVEIGEPIGELALEWLRQNQLEDGSWGTKELYYAHDRVISTLAAINALVRRGRAKDRPLLQRAETALEQIIKDLDKDPAGDTVGFELLVPTLMYEAKALGGIHYQNYDFITKLIPYRSAKLAALPKKTINRHVTTAFSSEMAGFDNKNLINIDELQEVNGSVGASPSATAYFVLYLNRQESLAIKYLREIAPQGMAPNVAPFDAFEPAWILWYLILTDLDTQLLDLCQPHLDHLQQGWHPEKGIGFSTIYTPKDGDDTGLVYKVLTHFKREIDLKAVLHYESVYHFRCYELESNPSVSANIHILDALRSAGLEEEHPSIQKILNFLKKVRISQTFWFDKWHASPYYATTHMIISCVGCSDEIIRPAVEWILKTQNADGSWGYYIPTAEETAYCIQSLAICKQYGYKISRKTLLQAKEWLQNHTEPPYPALWIGKCLYCPKLVIRAAILSALVLIEKI
ncbi:MAG: cyclase [Anaerolineae bacterium]|nr:cyclase [Anaerolineae bacterium]